MSGGAQGCVSTAKTEQRCGRGVKKYVPGGDRDKAGVAEKPANVGSSRLTRFAAKARPGDFKHVWRLLPAQGALEAADA